MLCSRCSFYKGTERNLEKPNEYPLKGVKAMTRDNAETCAAEVLVAAARAGKYDYGTKQGAAAAEFFNALVEGITTSEESEGGAITLGE